MENITLLLFNDLQILVSPLHDITLPLYLLVDSVTGFLNAFIKKFIMLPVETSQVIPRGNRFWISLEALEYSHIHIEVWILCLHQNHADLTLKCIISQNGQTHLKNFAANTAIFLTCV